jgi:bifunctional DNA-binding transcriptional regulator/antitoxin component of YhaV-PrlF toxin-antitoxin module
MIKKVWTVDLQEDPITSDMILEFPPEVLEQAGWREGDSLIWKDNGDGSFMLTKQETEWVLVECVSTFRNRYMVEVPKGTDDYGKDKSLWALDTVTMEEAKEFSQEYLGKQIVSHRVLTYDEAIALSDTDNDYTTSWDNDTKVKNFFTTLADQENE